MFSFRVCVRVYIISFALLLLLPFSVATTTEKTICALMSGAEAVKRMSHCVFCAPETHSTGWDRPNGERTPPELGDGCCYSCWWWNVDARSHSVQLTMAEQSFSEVTAIHQHEEKERKRWQFFPASSARLRDISLTSAVVGVSARNPSTSLVNDAHVELG